MFKENKCCIFWNLDDVYKSVAIVNLGKKLTSDFNALENYNERHESVRNAAAGISLSSFQLKIRINLSVSNFI